MNKGPWGGMGAEFLKSGGVVGWNVGFSASVLLLHIVLNYSQAMYNLMMATTMAETCSC